MQLYIKDIKMKTKEGRKVFLQNQTRWYYK